MCGCDGGSKKITTNVKKPVTIKVRSVRPKAKAKAKARVLPKKK